MKCTGVFNFHIVSVKRRFLKSRPSREFLHNRMMRPSSFYTYDLIELDTMHVLSSNYSDCL